MSRDVNLFLEDMQMACEKVIRYVKDLKQTQFLKEGFGHKDEMIF